MRTTTPRLPHRDVYVRLRKSRIHGVGVFAIRSIPKGTYIFPDDDQELVWIDKRRLPHSGTEERKLYDDFCVIKGTRYGCPTSFNNLTPSWYFNESSHPNVASDHEYRFYALRRIGEGEELTVDYDSYSDRPWTKQSTTGSERTKP